MFFLRWYSVGVLGNTSQQFIPAAAAAAAYVLWKELPIDQIPILQNY